MTDKEFRHLSRTELVDIIFEYQKRYEKCKAENQRLKQKLEKRELDIAQAGSLAEAVISINGVLEAAQAAADQYLLSAKAAETRAKQILEEAGAQSRRTGQKMENKARQTGKTKASAKGKQDDKE